MAQCGGLRSLIPKGNPSTSKIYESIPVYTRVFLHMNMAEDWQSCDSTICHSAALDYHEMQTYQLCNSHDGTIYIIKSPIITSLEQWTSRESAPVPREMAMRNLISSLFLLSASFISNYPQTNEIITSDWLPNTFFGDRSRRKFLSKNGDRFSSKWTPLVWKGLAERQFRLLMASNFACVWQTDIASLVHKAVYFVR